MATDRSYVARNNAERARLKALVARASDADLAKPMPAGWTVAAVLGHLAFWDQRIITLLESWQGSSVTPPVYHEEDVDWINDAGKPFLLALPPRKAADLAVTIAESVDGMVEGVSDGLIEKNTAAGSPLNLDRSFHRKEHLDAIEKVLK
jgi:mycothiol maleylpyruvate isomerase-like protein